MDINADGYMNDNGSAWNAEDVQSSGGGVVFFGEERAGGAVGRRHGSRWAWAWAYRARKIRMIEMVMGTVMPVAHARRTTISEVVLLCFV